MSEQEQSEKTKEEQEQEKPKEEKEPEKKEEKEKKVEEKEKKEGEEKDKGKEGEEKELSAEEEDRKELYDAIKDLKPDEANDNTKTKLISIADIHLDYKKVENDNYGKEYDTLQDKYDKQYQIIDDKIDDIVKTKEKIEITPEEMEKYGITNDDAESHEIEDYWEKVILNSNYFTITEKDKKILKYIKRVKMVKFPDNVNNFRVDFIFQPNDFFTQEVISKTYEYDKDAVIKKAIGTDIDWKSKDKNPTIEKVRKKIKKGKKVFYNEKEEKVDSFFSFFSQVEDMTFIQDEVTFFRDDLFVNQLEYYMDIVSKTKHPADEDDLDDEEEEDHNNNKDNTGGNVDAGNGTGADGKKEECKQQ
jgi:hypothetical protein